MGETTECSQEKDRQRIRSDPIDYDYFAESSGEPSHVGIGFRRPLREILPRIELLGFTLERVKAEYEGCTRAWSESRAEDMDEVLPPISFSEFAAFATAYPVQALDDTYTEDNSRIQRRFRGNALSKRIPPLIGLVDTWTLSSWRPDGGDAGIARSSKHR